MKKLLSIVLFFICLKSFGQNGYPLRANIGNDSSIVSSGVNFNGGFKGRIINNPYTDTTAANLQNPKAYPGAQIFTTSDNNFWIRNSTASQWVQISGSGGGGFTSANNGLSNNTSTNVQLGQNLGAVGNPGILTSNREIPFAAYPAASTLYLTQDYSAAFANFPQGRTYWSNVSNMWMQAGDGANVNIVVLDSTNTLGSSFPGHYFYAGYNHTLQGGMIMHWASGDKHVDLFDARGSITYVDVQFGGLSTIDWRNTGETYMGILSSGTHRVGINRGLGSLGAMFDVNGTSKFADSMFLFSRIGSTSDSIYTQRSDGSLGAIAQSSLIGVNIYNSDGRFTGGRTASAANNAFKLDSLGDGTRFVSLPKILGGRLMRFVSTNGTDSGFVSISGDLSTTQRAIIIQANKTSTSNIASITTRAGAVTDIQLNVYGALLKKSIIAMDSAVVQIYRVNPSTGNPAAAYFYDDSVLIWSGATRQSQISLFPGGASDQWATNRLSWRTLDSTAKIILTQGFAYTDSRDSIVFDNTAGYYRFTTMASTTDTTTYKPVVMDVNGKIKRANSIVQFSSGASGLTIGTTTITSGNNTFVLMNNAGVLGEYSVTGTAGAVALSTSPVFVTKITSPVVNGSTSADGTLTLQGNNAGAGNTSSAANILFKAGNTPTTAMTILNSTGVTIGAPTANVNAALIVQSFTNTSSDGIDIRSLNNAGVMHIGYQKMSYAGVLQLEGLGGTQYLGLSSAVYGSMTSAGLWNFGGSATATSNLSIQGSFQRTYIAKTGTYTATVSDNVIEATSGTFTLTLPTAVGITGREYIVTNSGSGVVTLGTTSSQTFANVTATPTTLTLAQYNTVIVISNGANWLRVTSL